MLLLWRKKQSYASVFISLSHTEQGVLARFPRVSAVLNQCKVAFYFPYFSVFLSLLFHRNRYLHRMNSWSISNMLSSLGSRSLLCCMSDQCTARIPTLPWSCLQLLTGSALYLFWTRTGYDLSHLLLDASHGLCSTWIVINIPSNPVQKYVLWGHDIDSCGTLLSLCVFSPGPPHLWSVVDCLTKYMCDRTHAQNLRVLSGFQSVLTRHCISVEGI